MIPKIYFNASYYLQAEIFGSYFDYNQISEIIIKFKKFFQKKEEKVMIKIEEMTGFLWNQRIISVWFFDSWHTSISYPLLLNIYHGDIDFIFFKNINEIYICQFLKQQGKLKLAENLNSRMLPDF